MFQILNNQDHLPELTKLKNSYFEFSTRHHQESSPDFTIYSPYEMPRDLKTITNPNFLEKSWDPMKLFYPHKGWVKIWLLVNEDQNICGELKLFSSLSLLSAAHHGQLSMGIDRKYHGQGLGKQLMNLAMTWAKSLENLQWIQLHTFSTNPKAIKFYESFGFYKIGEIPDQFRLYGQSINDLMFIKKLN